MCSKPLSFDHIMYGPRKQHICCTLEIHQNLGRQTQLMPQDLAEIYGRYRECQVCTTMPKRCWTFLVHKLKQNIYYTGCVLPAQVLAYILHFCDFVGPWSKVQTHANVIGIAALLHVGYGTKTEFLRERALRETTRASPSSFRVILRLVPLSWRSWLPTPDSQFWLPVETQKLENWKLWQLKFG